MLLSNPKLSAGTFWRQGRPRQVDMATFVNFNLGGKYFTTTKDTVLREPSSRLALVVRGILPSTKDNTDAYFIDRDAKYFQLILNYLRDGWCSLPKTAEERRELLQEVRYFQLAGMESWMRSQELQLEASASPAHASAALQASLFTSAQPQAFASQSCFAPRPVSAVAVGQLSPASPLRASNSFLNGHNQDLLAAGALAGFASACNAGAGRMIPTSPAGSHDAYSSVTIGSSSNSGLTGAGTIRPLSAGQYIYAGEVHGAAPAFTGPYPASPVASAAAPFNHYAPSAAPVDKRLLAVTQGPVQPQGQFWDSGDYMMARQGVTPQDGRPPAAAAADHLPRRYWCQPAGSQSEHVPSQFSWTARYLQSNPKMQSVVDTLMELAYMPPHPSLHAGKVALTFSNQCEHDKAGSSTLTAASQLGLDGNRFKSQVLHVKSNAGWQFELSLRPSSDLVLHDKYCIADFIQDNWYVLAAVLKDTCGVVMEEDKANRPQCIACRRHNVSITLQKHF